jgi:hypothetical protein
MAASAPLNVMLLERYPRVAGVVIFPHCLSIIMAGAGGGKCALHHNYGMQRSAVTWLVMLRQWGCAPADAGR